MIVEPIAMPDADRARLVDRINDAFVHANNRFIPAEAIDTVTNGVFQPFEDAIGASELERLRDSFRRAFVGFVGSGWN